MRLYNITSITLATLAASLFFNQRPLLGDDAESFLLRYKFQADQVIRYEVSLHDNYVVKIGELTEEPHSHQDSIKNYRVISVNEDGSAVIELMMESAKLDLFQNGAKAKFDSQFDKKPQEIFKPIASMIGRPHLKLTISPTGEVSNLQPLLNNKNLPNQLAIDVLVQLPEEPVKVGGIWKEDIAVPLSLPGSPLKQMVKLQRRYFVRSVENGIATITIKTKVLTPLSDPELEMQLLRRKPEGSMQIDLNRGLLLSRTLTQKNQVVNFGKGATQMDFKQMHTEKLLPARVATGNGGAVNR